MEVHTQHAHAAREHHGGHEHHELPTSGRALTNTAVSATLHCLTGCAIGEILGMAIGTALGFSTGAPSRSPSPWRSCSATR